MTDEETQEFTDACREWWQRPPVSWAIKAIVTAGAVGLLAWAAGVAFGLESVAEAADLAKENERQIEKIDQRLDQIEAVQERTYRRVRSIDEFLREGGGE